MYYQQQSQYNYKQSFGQDPLLLENEMLKQQISHLETQLQFVSDENEKLVSLYRSQDSTDLHSKILWITEENKRMEQELLQCHQSLERLSVSTMQNSTQNSLACSSNPNYGSSNIPADFITRVDNLEQELELCKAEKEAFADHASKVKVLFEENEKLLKLCEGKDKELERMKQDFEGKAKENEFLKREIELLQRREKIGLIGC